MGGNVDTAVDETREACVQHNINDSRRTMNVSEGKVKITRTMMPSDIKYVYDDLKVN